MMEQTKAELRKQYKQKRRALTSEQVSSASEQIRERFLNSNEYKDCNNLLIYVSQDNEVDTIEIIKQALTDGKVVAVPKVYGDHMHFHQIHGLNDLKAGAYGILEPAGCEMFHPTEGILIVPGIVFDKKGHRIGYGGGYYDRYMKLHPELTAVAFAYDYQVLSEISCEAFDERPDQILTPSEVYRFMENNMINEIDKKIDTIDITEPCPAEEPFRQYYFIKKAREYYQELAKKAGRNLTCSIQTYGCQMNVRDSEKLTGILEEIGYTSCDSEDADLVIYNTCTVRENANRKVYGHLGIMKHDKETHPDKMIGLCGCMMQEPDVVATIQKKYRFVDMVFGTHNVFKLAEIYCNRIEAGGQVVDIWKDTSLVVEDLPVKKEFPFKSGVNIMFGCNNFCTYCIVPYVRGRERSRQPEDIIREVKRLSKEGVKEIMLLGQNVNSYGKTLDEPMSFAKLLQKVTEVDGIERVRFMTSHPKDLSDELIDVIAANEKICRHIHLPMQSGSSRILKQMNRRYTKESYLELVDKIRRQIPDISLTTDIIVGFPGETEEDFLETMDVVNRVRFDTAFTFIYSKRTGTPAATFENHATKEEIQNRFDRLIKRVSEISSKEICRYKGQVMPVLIESVSEQNTELLTGRLSNNILVHFKGDPAMIGEIRDVSLDECKGFYYMGKLV